MNKGGVFMFDGIIGVIKAKTNQMAWYGCEYAENSETSIPEGINEEEYKILIEALDELIEESMSAGRMY